MSEILENPLDTSNNQGNTNSQTNLTLTTLSAVELKSPKDLNAHTFREFQIQYYRILLVGQTVDRNQALSHLNDQVETLLRVNGLYTPLVGEGLIEEAIKQHSWQAWDDKKFFMNMLKCLPLPGDSASASKGTLIEELSARIEKIRFPNIGELNEAQYQRYMHLMITAINEVGGWSSLTEKQHKTLVKTACIKLIEANPTGSHNKTAKEIVRNLLVGELSRNLRDYLVALGQGLIHLRAAKDTLTDFGIIDDRAGERRSQGGNEGSKPAGKRQHTDDKSGGRDKRPKHDSDSATLCRGCGNAGHTHDSCKLSTHPDYNKSGTAWADTRQGKLFKDGGYTSLPWTRKLDGDKVVDYSPTDKKCKCYNCTDMVKLNYTYDTSHTNDDTVLGRRSFCVLREKQRIWICYQIVTIDTVKASSTLIDNSGVR